MMSELSSHWMNSGQHMLAMSFSEFDPRETLAAHRDHHLISV